jgi:hypothetical protein
MLAGCAPSDNAGADDALRCFAALAAKPGIDLRVPTGGCLRAVHAR